MGISWRSLDGTPAGREANNDYAKNEKTIPPPTVFKQHHNVPRLANMHVMKIKLFLLILVETPAPPRPAPPGPPPPPPPLPLPKPPKGLPKASQRPPLVPESRAPKRLPTQRWEKERVCR